jgi:hypothetical protein
MSSEPHAAFPTASASAPITRPPLPNTSAELRDLITNSSDPRYVHEAVIPALEKLMQLYEGKDGKKWESVLTLSDTKLVDINDEAMNGNSAGLIYVL